MEGLPYPDRLWLGVHDQITILSLLSLCELEEYHSVGTHSSQGREELGCDTDLPGCPSLVFAFWGNNDARDLKHGLGQGQSAQSRLGVKPWWRLKHIPMGLDHLVPFSRAAQFKHHGGGRRGRTFRQRLVQAQEGLAARASLSCAIRFII